MQYENIKKNIPNFYFIHNKSGPDCDRRFLDRDKLIKRLFEKGKISRFYYITFCHIFNIFILT